MKALSLDSTIAEVHYTLALMYTWGMFDWESGEQSFKKAIMLKPNYPEARLYYSILNILGRQDEAKVQAETGIEQDPANPLILDLYAGDLGFLRQYEEALNILRKAFEIDPASILATWHAGVTYFSLGNYNDAFEAFKSAFSFQYSNLSHAFGEVTDGADIKKIFKKEADTLARQRTKSYILPTDIAISYFISGEYNKAIDWLEKGLEEKDPNMPYAISDPFFDPLKDEPRFREIAKKMNLPYE